MNERELTPQDYIAMLRRRWLSIVIMGVIGGALGFGLALVLPKQYGSRTLVLVEPPTVPADIVKPITSTDINQRLSSMQEQILSRTRLEPVIRQFDLYSKELKRKPIDVLVAKLRAAIEVTPVQPMAETRTNNLPGFFVTVTLDNPSTAQGVCTAITSMFIEENLKLNQQRSEDTTQFIVQQLGDAKRKLDEQDAKLAAFKSRYIGSLPDEAQTNLNLLAGLTSQLDAATQALARAQQDKRFTETLLTQQLSAWQLSQTSGNPENLEQQLTALQTQLASLRAKYTDDHPDVAKMKRDIAAIQKKIADTSDQKDGTAQAKGPRASLEPQQVTQLRAQVNELDQVIAEKTKEQEQIQQQIAIYQHRIQASPMIEQQYKLLTRDYQTALDFYNDLLKKRDQSAMARDLARHQQGEQFRVLDPANLPDQPSFPNRPLFAFGGLGGGLALGFALALLLELRDTSLRSEKDVELVLRLPVLAVVPVMESLSPRRQLLASSALAEDNVENVSVGERG